MSKIPDNLRTIGANIKQYALKYQRNPDDIQLLAVSKRHPESLIREAFLAGQTAFGENYAQELIDKAKAMSDLDIEWHYIGPLQSNKTRKIAPLASWVHTIDRFKIAKRLSEQRPGNIPPLSVCLQLNISGEQTKSGVQIDELPELAANITMLENLKLRGLMVIPAPQTEIPLQREAFKKTRQALDMLNQQGHKLDTLSMGMSNDMEAAIAEGATIVRIGTAIFGPRQ